MRNRISYYILSLLHLHGSVRIPGLGRFVHDRRASRLDPDNSLIFPPQRSGTFIQDASSNGSLLEKYVAYREEVSRIHARRQIVQFANDVSTTLRSEGITHLEYLGDLRQREDVIWFDPDLHYINPGHAALPVVKLPPALYTAEPVIEEEVVIPPPVVREEIKEEQAKPVQPARYEAPVIPISRSVEGKPEAEPSTQEVRIQAKKEENNGAQVDASKRPARWLIPLVACVILIIAASLFLILRKPAEATIVDADPVDIPEYNEEIPAPQDEEIPVAFADTGSNEPAETTDEAFSPEEEPQIVEPAEEVVSTPAIISSDSELPCMIVTGAFSQTSNADRMAHKLRSMGYQVRTIQKGSLAQVGVPVQCDGDEMRNLEELLRTNVEPGAWLLRPVQ